METIMYMTPANVKNALTIKPKLSLTVVIWFSLPNLSMNLISDASCGTVIGLVIWYSSVDYIVTYTSLRS